MRRLISILAVHQGSGLGGAPVSLIKLLAALDPAAFQPTVVFTEPGDLLGYAHALGVPAQVVPTGGALFYSAHARLDTRSVARFVRSFPSAVQTARRVLRQARPDVLHLNTSVLVAWAAAARREHVPVLWQVREVLGPQPLVRAWQASFIQSHARRVVVISDFVAACFAGPTTRVYNAVDLAEFDLALMTERTAVRREIGVGPDAEVIMAIGSVQRVKGHWLLLDAFRRLNRPAARLVLVCGGVSPAYRQSLRGRVKRALGVPMDNLDLLLRDAARAGLTDRVHVTGYRRDIARVLTAADVLVFPSLAAEGFGRPIIEGMAMARPVIATAIGPSAELLGPAAGVPVPPSSQALSEAIATLLADPERRAALGRAGRARVEQSFSLTEQVQAMSNIYREVARIG